MYFDIGDFKKIDKKWNISSFTSSSKEYRNKDGKVVNVTGNNVLNVELAKDISEINAYTNKLQKDYDQLYREMTLVRNNIKKSIAIAEASNAKLQDIASMYSTDVALMRNQLSVIDSKQKLFSDKAKNIRDSRKAIRDAFKAMDGGNVNNNSPQQQVIVANSPLSVSRLAATMNDNNAVDIGSAIKSLPVISQPRHDGVSTEVLPEPVINNELNISNLKKVSEEPTPVVVSAESNTTSNE